MKTTTHRSLFAVIALAMFVLGACATAPVTTDELKQPTYTVERARLQGAEEHPEARSYLNRAQEKLDQAVTYIQEEEHELARAELVRAQADAELALAWARLDRTRSNADAMLKQVRLLETNLPE